MVVPKTPREVALALIQKTRELPATFKMESWGRAVPADEKHPCGAVGCIAGNAALIRFPRAAKRAMDLISSDGFSFLSCGQGEATLRQLGCKALGLTNNIDAWGRLFLVDHWPQHRLYTAWINAKTAKGRAGAIRKRLEHFLKHELNGKRQRA